LGAADHAVALAPPLHTQEAAKPSAAPAPAISTASTQPPQQVYTFTEVEQKELLLAKAQLQLRQAKKALRAARAQARENAPATRITDALTRRYGLPAGVQFKQQSDGQIVAVK
jgi:hypothetical protein